MNYFQITIFRTNQSREKLIKHNNEFMFIASKLVIKFNNGTLNIQNLYNFKIRTCCNMLSLTDYVFERNIIKICLT